MGWQGKDPSTDFRYATYHFIVIILRFSPLQLTHITTPGRGGGFISLENLLYFARSFPVRIYKQLQKSCFR